MMRVKTYPSLPILDSKVAARLHLGALFGQSPPIRVVLSEKGFRLVPPLCIGPWPAPSYFQRGLFQVYWGINLVELKIDAYS